MINKIGVNTEKNAFNSIVTKYFQRNLQSIETKSAYAKGKLYYKEWIIKEYHRFRKYAQSYYNGSPIKNSKHKIDYEV